MKVSITFEASMGLTWPLWKRLTPELEDMGFSSVFRSDHFPDGRPSLELITSLTYLADHTRRIDFGTLVSPLSFRDPVLLSQQAMSLNDLSDGRMILGVGTGWVETEHTTFGYSLGNIKTRIDRLAEGLEVIVSLVRNPEPVNFQGNFFHLNNAQLLPRPQQPTRVLIGGNGSKRTLPLIARYADIWNCPPTSPEIFNQLSMQLDGLILAAGRKPADVKRTVMIPIMVWRDSKDYRTFLDKIQAIVFPGVTERKEGEIQDILSQFHAVTGSLDQVIERMQAYSNAGVDEFITQWWILDDFEGLEVIAKEILPHFARQ